MKCNKNTESYDDEVIVQSAKDLANDSDSESNYYYQWTGLFPRFGI